MTHDEMVRQREATLEAQVAALTAAILSVDVDENDWCPFCKEHPSHSHAPSCVYQSVKAQAPKD